MVKLLIENGADIHFIDESGNTILMRASYYGHTEIVKNFVECGVDINLQNKFGYTALVMASGNGYRELEEYLESLK